MGLNLIIPVIQIFAGIFAHSMALVSDATHNFSDFTTVLISYIAYRIGQKGAGLKNTFGYRRAEVMAAQVKIIPAATDDFTITETIVKNGTDIKYDFEKIQDDSGVYYLLTVHNQRQTPGRYFDLITAKTDTTPIRFVKIRIAGNIIN